MIPHDTLAAELSAALESQRRHGRNTWQRFADWTRNAPRWDDTERGGGVGSGRSDFAIADQRDDKQAAAYQAELAKLTERISADLHRLRRLHDIANPDSPRSQPEAGCVSCARDGGRYEPTWEGRYRTACRFCGEWRSTQGDWPPLSVVRWRGRNPGKRVPVHVVEKAG